MIDRRNETHERAVLLNPKVVNLEISMSDPLCVQPIHRLDPLPDERERDRLHVISYARDERSGIKDCSKWFGKQREVKRVGPA